MTASGGVVRFSPTERAFHWSFALGYLALLASGLPLMVPALRSLIRDYTPIIGLRLHLACAVLWVVATVVPLLLGDRQVLRRVWRDLTRLGPHDRVWLRHFPRWLTADTAERERFDAQVGRFNGAQKLNALFTAVTSALLLVSGIALIPTGDTVLAGLVTGPASIAYWRFLHRWLALIVLLPIVGHVFFALVFPATRPSLSGILSGTVDRRWAAAHHPRWTPDP